MNSSIPDRTSSILYDEATFYKKFSQDLLKATTEVIIESPFITTRRLNSLKPIFERLVRKGVKVFILTRPPEEHDRDYAAQAEIGIRYFEVIGIQPLLCRGGHHRKVAMIDRRILWEGSLNILSQSHSRELMERTESNEKTQGYYKFLKYDKVCY